MCRRTATSAWQLLVVLVHDQLTNFQIEAGAVRRSPTRKRTVLPVLQTVQALRFVLFHRAAQISLGTVGEGAQMLAAGVRPASFPSSRPCPKTATHSGCW